MSHSVASKEARVKRSVWQEKGRKRTTSPDPRKQASSITRPGRPGLGKRDIHSLRVRYVCETPRGTAQRLDPCVEMCLDLSVFSHFISRWDIIPLYTPGLHFSYSRTHSGLTLTYNRRAPPAETLRGNSPASGTSSSPQHYDGHALQTACLAGGHAPHSHSFRADRFQPVDPVPRRMPRAVGSRKATSCRMCHLVYFTISARGSSHVRMLTALLERTSVMAMKMPSGTRPYCQCSKSPWLSGALP